VERELSALETQGARVYDPAACDCVRALLDRAEELGGGVGKILIARAGAHVTSLTERFERDRLRVRRRLETLEQSQGNLEPVRRLIERGEVTLAGSTLRRLAVEPHARLRLREVPPQQQESPRLPGRQSTPPGRLSARASQPPEPRPPRSDVRSLRKQRAVAYEDSVASLVASFALARAVDVVPEDAGPYNPLLIASSTLDRMREVSPFYLTVQLNRLEELASLLALPELPAPPAPPVPEKPQKALPRKKPSDSRAPARDAGKKPSDSRAPARDAGKKPKGSKAG
jgi:hypothetical protein